MISQLIVLFFINLLVIFYLSTSYYILVIRLDFPNMRRDLMSVLIFILMQVLIFIILTLKCI